MNKSWCLSYREFPEVFKTPLTFYPTFNMKAVVANQNMKLWATSFALVGCIYRLTRGKCPKFSKKFLGRFLVSKPVVNDKRGFEI